MPCRYISCVPSPMGSTNTWCLFLSGNLPPILYGRAVPGAYSLRRRCKGANGEGSALSPVGFVCVSQPTGHLVLLYARFRMRTALSVVSRLLLHLPKSMISVCLGGVPVLNRWRTIPSLRRLPESRMAETCVRPPLYEMSPIIMRPLRRYRCQDHGPAGKPPRCGS